MDTPPEAAQKTRPACPASLKFRVVGHQNVSEDVRDDYGRTRLPINRQEKTQRSPYLST